MPFHKLQSTYLLLTALAVDTVMRKCACKLGATVTSYWSCFWWAFLHSSEEVTNTHGSKDDCLLFDQYTLSSYALLCLSGVKYSFEKNDTGVNETMFTNDQNMSVNTPVVRS